MQITLVNLRFSPHRALFVLLLSIPLVHILGCGPSAAEAQRAAAVGGADGNNAIADSSSQIEASNQKTKGPTEDALLDQLGLKTIAVEPKTVVQKPSEDSNKEMNSEVRESGDRRRRWVQTHELPLETWEIQYLGNKPVGYNHEQVKGSAIGSEGILRIDAKSLSRISKNNEKLNQTLDIISIEQVDGKLRSIEVEFTQGETKEKTFGNVVLDKLRLRTETKEGIKTREVKWRPEVGGPFAIMQTLRRKPMKPGEVRELEMLDPLLGDIVTVRLVAGDLVNTPRLDGEQISMLEIRSTATHDRREQKSIIWTDENGLLQKSYSSRFDIRSFKCDESLVRRVRDALTAEAKEIKVIPIAGDTAGIENAPQVIMKINHSDGDGFRLIPQDEFQALQNVAPFDVTFRIARPSILGNDFKIDAEKKFISDPSYRQPSPILQSRDSIIERIAKEFLSDETLGEQPLQRLVRGVGRWITDKTDFSPAMETASETVRMRRGSGNEHAILLAALIRSQGIPTRVITGMRMKPGSSPPVMEYHAWTEMEVDGRWLSVDAMQPSGETNSTYLRLTESSLSSYNPYEVMLPTLEIINKLSFSIEPPK